jgi:hypothetical protein
VGDSESRISFVFMLMKLWSAKESACVDAEHDLLSVVFVVLLWMSVLTSPEL